MQPIRRRRKRTAAQAAAPKASGRAYAYTRASTEMQVNDGATLEVQERMLGGYATMKDLRIERTFEERAVSGGKPFAIRPAGSEFLATVEPGDTVICTKMDRDFRDLPDALETLKLFKERGVDLHLLDIGGSVTQAGVSELIFAIMAAVAQFDRHRIRERILDVRTDKNERGVYAGGRLPFGFSIEEGEGKERRLIPDHAELAAIGEMRGMKAGGASLRAIAERMTEKGFRCRIPACCGSWTNGADEGEAQAA